MTTHYLKTDPTWFVRVAAGEKTAELREHDRDFQAGDELVLVKVPKNGTHKAAEELSRQDGVETLRVTVTHVLPASLAPDLLPHGVALLSIALPAPVRTPRREESA